MKNFFIKNGRVAIDYSVIIVCSIIVFVGLIAMSKNVLYGLIGMCVALVSFFITYFFIYLLIDMHDTLKVIAEQQGGKTE